MAHCDYCRKRIIPTDGDIGDDDKIWIKEYSRRKKILLSKRKGIKKIFFLIFGFPNMPFYNDGTFDFCSKGCYNLWKEKVSILFEQDDAKCVTEVEEEEP